MKKVLVVDDQDMIRKLVNMSLVNSNYEIIEAESGDQAIQLVREIMPDLILLDIMMPGELDGLGVCQFIKNSDELKSIPVIFLTAKGQKLDIEEGMNAGANDYLLKPFSPQKLIEKVSNYIDWDGF